MSGALDRLTQASANEAIMANESAIRRSVNRFTPRRSGRLRASLRMSKQAVGVRLTWAVPYSKRQYWTNRSREWVKQARDADGRKWGRLIAKSMFGGDEEE